MDLVERLLAAQPEFCSAVASAALLQRQAVGLSPPPPPPSLESNAYGCRGGGNSGYSGEPEDLKRDLAQCGAAISLLGALGASAQGTALGRFGAVFLVASAVPLGLIAQQEEDAKEIGGTTGIERERARRQQAREARDRDRQVAARSGEKE